jgi:hypothetical protein
MMKKLILLAIIGAAAGCTANEPVQMSADDESRLNAELAGYEQAGPPVSCVSSRDIRGNRSAGEAAIIFQGATRNTLYVNRPAAGCPELGNGRALVTRTTTSQLCRGDIATVFDTASSMQYGGCGLGDFTPYRRVRS